MHVDVDLHSVEVDVEITDFDFKDFARELESLISYDKDYRELITTLAEQYSDKINEVDFNFTYYPNKEYAKEYFLSIPNAENIIKFIKENF